MHIVASWLEAVAASSTSPHSANDGAERERKNEDQPLKQVSQGSWLTQNSQARIADLQNKNADYSAGNAEFSRPIKAAAQEAGRKGIKQVAVDDSWLTASELGTDQHSATRGE